MEHFFDVGANIGQTFDKFLLKTNDYDDCKVWCFEPSPRSIGALVETVKRVTSWPQKDVHRFQVAICPFGLWDKDGTFSFYEKSDALDIYGRENGEGDSFVKTFLKNNNAPYQICASTVSAADFINKNIPAGDRITIKIDCEGGEYGILENLLARPEALCKIKKFIVEWHQTEEVYKKDGLIKAYADLGYIFEEWPF
jgi:FkbM family methyltransferase